MILPVTCFFKPFESLKRLIESTVDIWTETNLNGYFYTENRKSLSTWFNFFAYLSKWTYTSSTHILHFLSSTICLLSSGLNSFPVCITKNLFWTSVVFLPSVVLYVIFGYQSRTLRSSLPKMLIFVNYLGKIPKFCVC